MTETNNNCPLITEINAPTLNSTEYASDLSGVFNNINDNFTKLANHDFIKGDTGDSVEIITYDLTDESNNYKSQIKSCIQKHFENREINEIVHEIGAFKDFDERPGSLQMICNKIVNENLSTSYEPVSSLYYVFLDSRFANKNIGKIDPSNFENITDASCIITYGLLPDNTNYGFKVLENVFPTIYYESEVGLCWKINGNNTGLPIQGIPGKNGLDTKLFIVKGNKDTNNGSNLTINITQIFDSRSEGSAGFINIENYLNKLEKDKNYSAIILTTDINDNNKNKFYFGTIKLSSIDNTIKGYSDTNNTINDIIQTDALKEVLKNINLKSTSNEELKGLFIPIDYDGTQQDGTNKTDQKVHLITAASITNFSTDSNNNTDIVCTPINDINRLNIDEEKNIKVDKYLYLKVNEEELERLITESWKEGNYTSNNRVSDLFLDGGDGSKFSNLMFRFKSILKSRNYILKYKLKNALSKDDINNNYSNIFQFNNDELKFDLNDNTTDINVDNVHLLLNNDLLKIFDIDNAIINELGDYEKIACFNNYTKYLSKKYIKARNNNCPSEYKYLYAQNDDGTVIFNINADTLTEVTGTSKFVPLEEKQYYFASARDITLSSIEDLNTAYEKPGNIYNFIPTSFVETLKEGKIYRWTLDLSYNESDPEELKSCVIRSNDSNNQDNKYYPNSIKYIVINNKEYELINENNISYLLNPEDNNIIYPINNIEPDSYGNIYSVTINNVNYSFKDIQQRNIKDSLIYFNTIFTNNTSLSESSEIMWFNGFSKDTRHNYGVDGSSYQTGVYDEEITDSTDARYWDPIGVINKKIADDTTRVVTTFAKPNYTAINIYGWGYDNKPLFKLLNYLPIFDIHNEFKLKEDTSLNINYNINVTGDNNDINAEKHVNVNGIITSNEVNTNTLKANEIKNIYTTDDIIINSKDSKLIISSDNDDLGLYTQIDNNSLITNNIDTTNININNSLNIYNNTKEHCSSIMYDANNNVDISLQGNAININLLNKNDVDDVEPIYVKTKLTTEGENHTTIVKEQGLETNLKDISFNDSGISSTSYNSNNLNNTSLYEDIKDLTTNLNSKISKEYTKYVENTENIDYDISKLAELIDPINYYEDKSPTTGTRNTFNIDNNYTYSNEYNVKKTNGTRLNRKLVNLKFKPTIFSKTIILWSPDKKLNGIKFNNKFELDTDAFRLYDGISIEINKVFSFLAGFYGERMDRVWPRMLHKNIESDPGKSYIHIYPKYTVIRVNAGNTEEQVDNPYIQEDFKEIKQFSSNSFNDWTGKNEYGNETNTIDDAYRFYPFHFKVGNIYILLDKYKDMLNKVISRLPANNNDTYKLRIDICCEIMMSFTSKTSIKDFYITQPVMLNYFKENNENNTGILSGSTYIPIYNIVHCERFEQNSMKAYANDFCWNNFKNSEWRKLKCINDNDNDNNNKSSISNIKFFSYDTTNNYISIPELNISNKGFYISNNSLKDNKIHNTTEIFGIGNKLNSDSNGTSGIHLIKATINDNEDKKEFDVQTLDLDTLFAVSKWYNENKAKLDELINKQL